VQLHLPSSLHALCSQHAGRSDGPVAFCPFPTTPPSSPTAGNIAASNAAEHSPGAAGTFHMSSRGVRQRWTETASASMSPDTSCITRHLSASIGGSSNFSEEASLHGPKGEPTRSLRKSAAKSAEAIVQIMQEEGEGRKAMHTECMMHAGISSLMECPDPEEGAQVLAGFAMGKTKGKQLYVGVFRCKEKAARAYDRAAIKCLGDKAKLNVWF
jgi:hypothetical protein